MLGVIMQKSQVVLYEILQAVNEISFGEGGTKIALWLEGRKEVHVSPG